MKSPRALGLPFDDWRVGQRRAIREALVAKPGHVVIQAPTGSGKSLIGAAVAVQLPNQRVMTLTATNGLLQQYDSGFSIYAPVKGAANYECLAAYDELKRYFRLVRKDAAITCDDGPCRAGVACSLKLDGCQYYDRVRAAANSKYPLTNYAYYLAMRRYAGGMGPIDRLIVDEAHTLPEELMKACQVEIFPHELKGQPVPKTIRDWRGWAAAKKKTTKELSTDDDHRVRAMRAIDRYERLMEMDQTWAYDRTPDKFVFQPTVPKLLFPLLAESATRIVYLSATVTPSMLALCGVDESDILFHSMPSTFPVDRRPVYLVATGRIDHKHWDTIKDFLRTRIDRTISQRLDRKGIIHTGSYERQRWFLESSIHRRYEDGGILLAPRGHELADTIETFKQAKAPCVLVSPSIEQGFDFPYTDCEYQVIVKVPFPDTRSAIMRARIEATERYREYHTMTRLIQAVGRGMRASDDQCETFIFDDHARWFLKVHADLAPDSFLDAIVPVRRVPEPPPRLAA